MIKEQKKRVKRLLSKFPETRDNNNLLLTLIWEDDCKKKNLNENNILRHILNGDLTNPETIFRNARKLQELYPYLRGKLRKERMLKQIEVIHEIVNYE